MDGSSSLCLPIAWREMRLAAIGLVLAVGAFCAACSLSPQKSDLYGTYVAKYHTGTERLTINKDGSFSQEVTLESSREPVENTGSWTWDASTHFVYLAGCLSVNDGRGGIRPDFATGPRGCSFPLERRWFFGRLLLGPDESSPLLKQ